MDDGEYSIDIDPRKVSDATIKLLGQAGFNRISIGVQDFDGNVQAAVNPVQSDELVNQSFRWSREIGIKNINADLVYGLPLQKTGTFKTTLDKIIDLSPERIAVFNFAYVPWIKHHKRLLKEEQLPSPQEKLLLLQLIINTLMDAGYEYIGMQDKLAHQVKPGLLPRWRR